jgi:hypothetical protein
MTVRCAGNPRESPGVKAFSGKVAVRRRNRSTGFGEENATESINLDHDPIQFDRIMI